MAVAQIPRFPGAAVHEPIVIFRGPHHPRVLRGVEEGFAVAAAASSFLDTLQAIAAEASDYSRRSLENRCSFVAKLCGATTFESAIQIQSEHAKTSYTDYIAYVTKMTKLRA